MVTTRSVLLIVLVVFVALCHGLTPERMLLQMQDYAEKTTDGVVHLDSGKYKQLISEPRNYSVLLLLTATHSKYNCVPCKTVADAFASFGYSVKTHFGGFKSDEFLVKPIFVTQIEPDNGMDIFQSLQLQTVPHIVYLAPTKKKLSTIKESSYLKSVSMPHLTADNIRDFVKSKSGLDIPVYKSPLERYASVILFLSLAILAWRIGVAFYPRRADPMLWFTVAVIIYFVVMAGLIFNYLRGPPLMDVNPHNGEMNFISPNGRSQFIVEGFIVAGLLTASGILYIYIADFIPEYKSGVRQRFTFWIAGATFLFCLVLLNQIFAIKFHMPAFRIVLPFRR